MGISLAIHAILLLVLSWFVVSSIDQSTISLTATTAAPAESGEFVSIASLPSSSPSDADVETLIDINPLGHGDLLASLNSTHLRPRFQPAVG